MSKVFVTQYSKNLKFGEADKFGEVVFLTDQEYKPEPTMPGSNESITVEIARKMKDYIVGVDYIVLTGSAIPNVIVGAIVNNVPGRHKFLKWARRDNKYELFILEI